MSRDGLGRVAARPVAPRRVRAVNLLLPWVRGSLPRWVRRSMRVRVVGLTLILGSVVVLGVGNFVLNDVANGLAQARTRQAIFESAGAAQQVQNGLDSFDGGVPLLEPLVERLVQQARGSPAARDAVLLRAEDNTSPVVVRPRYSGSLVATQVSTGELVTPELRRAVTRDPQVQQSQQVAFAVSADEQVPAVVVGSMVRLPAAGDYELYLIYRMDDQVATLRLVERAFVIGGIALVALVGTIAWLVARLVVTPVRDAARTAEQLAAGELDRRMTVRGEDEVARLAASFNIMAASLQAQITRLESLSRLQQRFVSDVSHELRTPLTTIRMAADVLHDRLAPDGTTDPDLVRSVVLLSSQIDRFEALLADLLEVSRFDAGAAVLDVQSVDAVEVVRQCVDLTAGVCERYGVQVVVEVGPDAAGHAPDDHPPADTRVQADPRRVSRIVRNLLSNAIEHAEGRDVVVRVVADAHAVAVGVRDRGVGMSPDQLERVFDRFWRGDPSRRRTLGGSGLGLSIAMEDARLHGGRIEVWSRRGEGAHFVVTLPRRARAAVGPGPLPVRPDEPTVTGAAPEQHRAEVRA